MVAYNPDNGKFRWNAKWPFASSPRRKLVDGDYNEINDYLCDVTVADFRNQDWLVEHVSARYDPQSAYHHGVHFSILPTWGDLQRLGF